MSNKQPIKVPNFVSQEKSRISQQVTLLSGFTEDKSSAPISVGSAPSLGAHFRAILPCTGEWHGSSGTAQPSAGSGETC